LARNELPTSVQHLIRHHFDTAVDVETLLLLQRDHRGWTAPAVARELRINEDQARDVLNRLRRTGLLRTDDGDYTFDPRDPALAGAAAALAQLYPTYRLAVVSLIYGAT
jgi:DNA-binding IclR family transcriptional regulator